MTRACGDCSLCCKLLDIQVLEKPRDTWCPHVILKRGCGVYSTRPDICRNFQCLWLMEESLGEFWKPNKCKMMIVPEAKAHIIVYVDKGVKEPWKQEPYFSSLRELSVKALSIGGMVSVYEEGETIVILPDRAVALGKLQNDDRIKMSKSMTAGGQRFDVTVVKV